MSQDNNLLNLSWLCNIAAVSRVGYYHYMAAETKRERREQYDREEFSRVLEVYNYRSYSKGARSIYMHLLRQQQSTRMNIKKIRRLMNKYGLKCPIRKPNPYRGMLRASLESRTAPRGLMHTLTPQKVCTGRCSTVAGVCIHFGRSGWGVFDMFPRPTHVECVIGMQRKDT